MRSDATLDGKLCILSFITPHESPTNSALLIGRVACPIQPMGDGKPSTRVLAKFFASRPHEAKVTIDHISPHGRYVVFTFHLGGFGPKVPERLSDRIITRTELLRHYENLHDHSGPGFTERPKEEVAPLPHWGDNRRMR